MIETLSNIAEMACVTHDGHELATAGTIAGFAGMACIVYAYWYTTTATRINPFVQHGVNLAGAILLTLSLLVNMNPASFVLEFFWAGIAIWGLYKAIRARQAGQPGGQS